MTPTGIILVCTLHGVGFNWIFKPQGDTERYIVRSQQQCDTLRKGTWVNRRELDRRDMSSPYDRQRFEATCGPNGVDCPVAP